MSFKTLLKKLPFVSALAGYYRLKNKKIEVIPKVDIEAVLKTYVQSCGEKKPYFVTVGANDGTVNDYLAEYVKAHLWPGMMIEPVRSTFEKLVENYADCPQIRFENVGIGNENGTLPIFKFSEAIEGKEYHQLFSFDKNQLMKLDVPDAWKQNHIVEETVEITRLTDLLLLRKVGMIDILQIDAEGFDFNVLKSLDFQQFHPDLVIYEHCHLRWDVYYESILYLRNAGYFISAGEFDTLALSSQAKAIVGL